MRLIPFLLLVLCALLEPFPVARAFEGARTPVIVGFQVDGIEPYESFVSNTKAALSEVLDDRAFIFKPIAREALSNPDRTAELDYLFCSAGVFAALQHYAGFSREATQRDPRASLLRSIPGFGVLTTSRWCAVVGDIARFDSPKQTMAFIGLVPNNRITGHHTETSSGREARGQGKMSKRGDKMLRSLCILGAGALCLMVRNDRLPDCPFVASIKERLASPRPWFKVLVYVAAKLVRIATALLKYGETFSFEKAGISKAVLKQWELEQAKAA